MSERQLYTPEEINALIPRLEFIMARLQQSAIALRQAAENVEHAAGEGSVRALLEARPDLRSALDEFDALLHEIEAMGGEFKGLELGLVDFPGEVAGEPVLLCWQFGEKEVAYYHAREEGFAGRRLLSGGRLGYVQ